MILVVNQSLTRVSSPNSFLALIFFHAFSHGVIFESKLHGSSSAKRQLKCTQPRNLAIRNTPKSGIYLRQTIIITQYSNFQPTSTTFPFKPKWRKEHKQKINYHRIKPIPQTYTDYVNYVNMNLNDEIRRNFVDIIFFLLLLQ